MPNQNRIVSPGPRERTVLTSEGQVLEVPAHWELLPPGDAGLTRRFKAAGPTWTVIEFVRRKKFSRGVWGNGSVIAKLQAELAAERDSPAYAKRRAADSVRREKKQTEYVEDFRGAVLQFLAFHPAHAELAGRLATAVADHATPVGSGTVARTERIPIEQRAEAAVIAWLRHQTTAYDSLQIGRAKGLRREIRQQLAQQSRLLLSIYRSGGPVNQAECPLQQALSGDDDAFIERLLRDGQW